MNNELKKKLIDFDTKTDVLWESMESIQFDNPELLDELGSANQELIKSFDRIKNAMMSIPKEVYGISKREETEESVESVPHTEHSAISNNSIDKQYYTHIFCDGKWCLASEVKE